MKRIILTAFLIGSFAFANADTVKSTYYGEKASENGINPCKGKLLRVCAIVEREIKDIDPINPGVPDPAPGYGTANVSTTTYDGEGNVVSRITESTLKSKAELIEEYMMNVPENAIVTLSE